MVGPRAEGVALVRAAAMAPDASARGRSNPSRRGSQATIDLTRTNRGGATDSDYSGVPSSVTFGASETSKTFTVTAVDDSVKDDNESVPIRLRHAAVGGDRGQSVHGDGGVRRQRHAGAVGFSSPGARRVERAAAGLPRRSVGPGVRHQLRRQRCEGGVPPARVSWTARRALPAPGRAVCRSG